MMRPQKPLRILVVRLSALGDVAMTIPAVYSVANAWPQHTFYVVTSAFCAQLFVSLPSNIIIIPVTQPISTWHLLMKLHHLPIDAVADLHNVMRSWVIDAYYLLLGRRVAMLSKSRKERIGLKKHWYATSKPFIQRYFDVFFRLNLPCIPTFYSVFPTLPPSPVAEKRKNERWIGIAPFARYKNKTYPLSLMQKVVMQLVQASNTRVFLFGSKGHETTVLKEWEKLSPVVECVAGRFSLQEELALMAHLDMMLTMDSANMHLASVVGTRVISIWGSTTPACGFLGYRQRQQDVRCLGISCQPCTISGSNCCPRNTFECLEKLQPQEVLRDSVLPALYIIKPTYFMSTYILQELAADNNIHLIEYEKRRMRWWEKVLRFLRAYCVNRSGLWTNHILRPDLLSALSAISATDSVLFFGTENLKDLRIMEHEIAARRKSVFLWNTVNSRYKGWLQLLDFRSFFKRTSIQIGTFDSQDALRYGLCLFPQVYRFPEIDNKTPESSVRNDVFFVGKDKKRSEILLHMLQLFKAAALTIDFYILKDATTKNVPELKEYYKDVPLSYKETLGRIKQSRCILEIVQDGQTGSTLRAMEALFFGKKLLTNNTSIQHEDFYHPSNVLVIDTMTKASDIASFLALESVPIPREITNKHDVRQWVQHFM